MQPTRKMGPETRKNAPERITSGFYKRFMNGSGIDIGYGGGARECVLESAHGIDKDTPGYDGLFLPYADNSLDYVFSSHCLEHIPDYKLTATLREWMRVLKVGGHLVTCVPHRDLYEKKLNLPSSWSPDHKRFYTPASLMKEFEDAYEPNTYRLRHLRDLDTNYDYRVMPNKHPNGSCEIESVLQKRSPPPWSVK